MSLISEKIKKVIKTEIKAQETTLKILENQEVNYGLQLGKEKEFVKKTINNYNKMLIEEE